MERERSLEGVAKTVVGVGRKFNGFSTTGSVIGYTVDRFFTLEGSCISQKIFTYQHSASVTWQNRVPTDP